jgi:hypothetical protein
MRLPLLAALIAACTARADHATPTPTPAATPPATASVAAPKLAANFDTALLCTNILATGKLLGDPSFGMTESDPPAPSTVGAVTYAFGNEPRLLVSGMSAGLPALGSIAWAGHTIAATASLQEIAAMHLDGCGEIIIAEGGNTLECRAGEVHVTFAKGSIEHAVVQVSARHDACH